MSDQQHPGQGVAVSPTRAFQQELDSYAPSFAQALPAHVSVEKFKRVLLTAVSQNPDLFYANRRTLFNAAVRCASDGLLPDGREAALVVYNTKIKRRNPETGLDHEVTIKAAQCLIMVAGVRKRMRNSGDVVSAIAEVVHKNDHFEYRLGDDAMIRHEPPPLGEDRGEAVGAYAIIKLKSGETIRDVMPRKDIEVARNQGRAKDSLMWTKFWGEGAKKTVLRRCAKSAPQSAEIEAMLDRDDDALMLSTQDLAALPGPGVEMGTEPEPEREEFVSTANAREPEHQFALVDLDGVVNSFGSAHRAYDAMRLILGEAARDSLARIDGVWQDNQPLLDSFTGSGNANLTSELASEYAELHQARVETDRRAAQAAAAGSPGADVRSDRTAAGELTGDVTEAQRSPLASEAAGPSDSTPKPEQAHSAPLPATEAAGSRPTPAGDAKPAIAPESGGGSPAPTAEAPASSPAGHGPTATSAASPSERPFPGDLPSGGGRPATADELRGNAAAERSDPGKLGGQPGSERTAVEEGADRRVGAARGGDAAEPAGQPAPTSGERKSTFIPLPVKQGKPDLRTWAVALFMPKLRRQRVSSDLAWLVGDNQETIEACNVAGALSRDDIADLNQSIKDQWRLVENG